MPSGTAAAPGHAQPPRRADPDRRSKIIDAALTVIAAEGVAGASHRKIAAVADVPLGSMTYYFTGMDELLREAFLRFADRVADRFDRRMSGVGSRSEALDAVAATVIDDIFSEPDDLVLTHELYTLAARDPSFRDITERWMGRTRAVLAQYVDPLTARLVDALIEGLTIHRALDRDPAPSTDVAEALRRIAGS
jgi:DNA-binding transcriptional regulator YbjK